MKEANLALRFLLELTALGIAGYWGWRTGEGLTQWALAVGAVLALVVVWMLFVSENPAIEIARPLRLGVEFAVWAAAGVALYATGHPLLGLAFVGIAVASGSLNYVLE